MGSYAMCWLDNLLVGSSKNEVDPSLISLFRHEDKIVLTRPFGDLPPQLQGYKQDIEADDDLKLVYYRAPTRVICDRMEVLGYDLITVEQAFQEWAKAAYSRRIDSLEDMGEKESEILGAHYRAEAEILLALTPGRWVESLRTIRSLGLKPDRRAFTEGSHQGTLIGYMLSDDWYGFTGADVFVPLRLAMETCEDGTSLLYDLTDLVWSDYGDYEEDFVEYGLRISATAYNARARTIVLTEGKTDTWILRESLRFLYPHLQDYFSFLDFESTGYGGGVGNLANVVKAFAGAGIANNVVALFDNDTAAAAACKAINVLALPENIAIRHLPRVDFLSSYPTIGPSGAANLDVNGVAASIELYLGEDVLRLDGQNLTPVQWTGYERSMGRYQGEVLDKPQIHARFQKKLLDDCDPLGPEWDSLRAVLKTVFSAFVDKNRAAICRYAAEYYI